MREMDETQGLCTLTDIAKAVGVSRWAVQQWAKFEDWPKSTGKIERSGRLWPGYPMDKVLKWLEDHNLPDRSKQQQD